MGVLAGLAVVAAMYALSDHRKWWLSGMVLAAPALVHHLSVKPELTSGFDVFGLVCSVLFDGFMTVFILLCHLRTSDDSSGDDLWSALRLSCDWFCLLEYLSIAGPLSAGIDLPGSNRERAQDRAASGFDLLQLRQPHLCGRERVDACEFLCARAHIVRVCPWSNVPGCARGAVDRITYESAARIASPVAEAPPYAEGLLKDGAPN